MFSSDNGPVLDDGYHDDAVEKNGDHTPKGVKRRKYSLFEAGSHVPFMGAGQVLLSQVFLTL